MKVLVILTSQDRLGNTERRKTGFSPEKLAAMRYVLTDAGVEMKALSLGDDRPPLGR
jgi:hypothetical protein